MRKILLVAALLCAMDALTAVSARADWWHHHRHYHHHYYDHGQEHR